jgi:hypothetical protein
MSKPNARQGVRLVVAATPEEKAFWRAEIARAYKAHAWDTQHIKNHRGEIGKGRLIALVRLRELESLYVFRYGEMHLPQGDEAAAREYLEITAHHIAHLHGEVENHIIAWSRRWASWLPVGEAKQVAKRVAAKPCKWTADSLARELNVTKVERDTLGLTTIGAVDFTKRQRTKAAKERRSQRDRKRRERAAAEAGRILRARAGRPRSTGARPWELAGMTRSTWYRKGKPGETIILTTQGEGNERCAFSSHASLGHGAAAPVEVSVVAFRGAKTGQRKPTHHWLRHQEQERKQAA